MNIVECAATLSNCQKRITVCVLFDEHNRPSGIGYNSCDPPISGCARKFLQQHKGEYTGQECNTIHAEIMALRTVHPNRKPVAAVLYGHDFMCKECEETLRAAGIDNLRVSQETYGTGLIAETKS